MDRITHTHAWSNARLVATAAALLVFVSACSARPADPRQAFPVVVSSETASLSVGVTEQGILTSHDESLALRKFVRDYANRGRGPLTINVGGANQDSADQLKRHVSALGIPTRSIDVRFESSAAQKATFNFVAYKADVPTCENNSSGEYFNWQNTRSPNFGCSVRRNIGLMVSDPGDLIRSKPSGGYMGGPAVQAIDNMLTPSVIPSGDASSAATGASSTATSDSGGK